MKPAKSRARVKRASNQKENMSSLRECDVPRKFSSGISAKNSITITNFFVDEERNIPIAPKLALTARMSHMDDVTSTRIAFLAHQPGSHKPD